MNFILTVTPDGEDSTVRNYASLPEALRAFRTRFRPDANRIAMDAEARTITAHRDEVLLGSASWEVEL